MSNFEKVRELVNAYVSEHGGQDEMTRAEFLKWVNRTYDNISAERNNLFPTDMSFNLYNAGLRDFPGPNLCLIYIEKHKAFRLVGSNYKYTGPIYQYKGKSNEKIVGQWIEGVCKMGDTAIDPSLPESILLRREDLSSGIKQALKGTPFRILEESRNVTVNFQEILICGVTVEDEGYKIYNASTDWKNKTTYHCDESEDGTWFYYLETIDECIGETQRLVMFEAQKGNKPPVTTSHSSELRQVITPDVLRRAYSKFIEQADRNAVSGKSQGSKVPEGFDEKPECDGAEFKAEYGRGNASAAPYMNWSVVSIYYLPDSGNIVIGIEEDRYPRLKSMKPIRYAQVGNKKIRVAVFYSSNKNNVDYNELHKKFIDTCEEVMTLGWN